MIPTLLLIFSLKWQASYMPLSDSSYNLEIRLEIPAQNLKFISVDSTYIAAYEIQLLVFDKKNNQLAGDYWFKEREKDTTNNFYDSVSLVIPNTVRRFNLKVIDLQGMEILNVYEDIKPINFLANVRSKFSNDTLILNFIVYNPKEDSGIINIYLQNIKKIKMLKPGIYEDSLFIFIPGISNGEYEIQFVIEDGGKRLGTFTVPVVIERPFYLDEKTWYLKVSQLEYIATPNELNLLRKISKESRDSLWKEFWKKYDPTPTTEYNEREVEYFERIAYAEEHFSFGDKGWRSDRGRIYVKFGPPDEIQSRPYEPGTKPYEIWFYYRLNLKFIFYDRHGFGEYILINPQGERI